MAGVASPEHPAPGARRVASDPPDFEAFWQGYPARGKSSKIKAHKAWQSAQKSQAWPGVEKVMAVLELWNHSERWCKPDPAIVDAERWLSQQRWDVMPEPWTGSNAKAKTSGNQEIAARAAFKIAQSKGLVGPLQLAQGEAR